ncbi:hypothetical protein BMS3Bbin10_02937 [bacterium BMS3Bbin10]|nr:hypothetical protein BMS3Bbin10_02937 [bacterium BMS3Bbin10]
MRGRNFICGAILALGISLLLVGGASPVHAQRQCVTFGQARKLGLFARFDLRPAAMVKNNVEIRTGGKVVSFLVCRSRSGPVYQLTVVRPNGGVKNVTVPAN